MEQHQNWLDSLELNETNSYREIEYPLVGGIRKMAFAKISPDKRYMTVIYHDHKNSWFIRKESVNSVLLSGSKCIQKNTFDYIVNQNLANL